jgi:hypothetical protein
MQEFEERFEREQKAVEKMVADMRQGKTYSDVAG